MNAPPRLTDRTALARHRARIRPDAAFLHARAAAELKERLAEVNRTFQAPALIGGAGWGDDVLGGALRLPDAPVLDLAAGAHDLVVHAFGLHWADDPVGQIIQCARALKPDGLFLAVTFGGRTLAELRDSLTRAEAELRGGASPRVAPMADIRDWGAALQRAGLAMPVADSDLVRVTYPNLRALAADLRAMGETNALAARDRRYPGRALFSRAEQIHAERHGVSGGRLGVTFELIWLAGWAPAPGQSRPLRPGSAQMRLADALGTVEINPEKDPSE